MNRTWILSSENQEWIKLELSKSAFCQRRPEEGEDIPESRSGWLGECYGCLLQVTDKCQPGIWALRTWGTSSATSKEQRHSQVGGEGKGLSPTPCELPLSLSTSPTKMLLNMINTWSAPIQSAAHSSWPPNHSTGTALNSATTSLPGWQSPWKKLNLYLTNCNLAQISMFQSPKLFL